MYVWYDWLTLPTCSSLIVLLTVCTILSDLNLDRLSKVSISCAAIELGYLLTNSEQIEMLVNLVNGLVLFAVLLTGFRESLCYAHDCFPCVIDEILTRNVGIALFQF